ncbi:hypothetical protein PM03_09555 [Thalassobacter stenotrophicus]|nr:hypothetical protein PM03_09555 [Thalassobacter stenotrophicus]KGL01683.1 hypothetical protein PM04_07805 [Thalassobacter sp. 16PALIMAR09]
MITSAGLVKTSLEIRCMCKRGQLIFHCQTSRYPHWPAQRAGYVLAAWVDIQALFISIAVLYADGRLRAVAHQDTYFLHLMMFGLIHAFPCRHRRLK